MREPLPWLDRLERALARPGAVASASPAGEARVDLEELCARVVAEARTEQAAAARRLDRLTTLSQITHGLLAAGELETVVRVVAESAARLCDVAGAIVQLIDDDRRRLTVLAAHGEPRGFLEHFQGSRLTEEFFVETAAGQAIARRRAIVIEDYERWPTAYALKAAAVEQGVRALVAAPLLADGAPIGVLWVSDTVARPFAAEDIALIEALADQAALAIQHHRLRARGEEAAVLEERARLARDLHDSVTQSIFSVHLMANAALAQQERGSPKLGATLARIRTIAKDALGEMRALLYELRPIALEEGLAKALEKLIAAMQVRVDVPIAWRCSSAARPEGDAEQAIFRIVQEALANAAKYARATAIAVTMTDGDGRITVTVEDDGVGFDPSAPATSAADGGRGGIGLRSMRERAVATGLSLRVESAPGAGSRVTVEAPIQQINERTAAGVGHADG